MMKVLGGLRWVVSSWKRPFERAHMWNAQRPCERGVCIILNRIIILASRERSGVGRNVCHDADVRHRFVLERRFRISIVVRIVQVAVVFMAVTAIQRHFSCFAVDVCHGYTTSTAPELLPKRARNAGSRYVGSFFLDDISFFFFMYGGRCFND